MKWFRFPFEDKRSNRKISIADSVVGLGLILFCCFAPILGVQKYLQRQFGFTEFWADAAVIIVAIFLMYLEQFITYHIDKHASK